MLHRWLQICLLVSASLLSTVTLAQPPVIASVNYQEKHPDIPDMVLDAAVARPLYMGATVVGAALFVVTLPFSLFGGNVSEAGQTLVAMPAHNALGRCLGCVTPIDH